MRGSIQRTLKCCIRLHDMAAITSDELLALDADAYQEVRRAATLARNSGTVAYVCDHCGYPAYAPREPRTKLPFWRHHRGAPQNCPWWTGQPSLTDDVNAKQFAGAQESSLHKRIKNLVAEILIADRLTEKDSVIVDQYIVTKEGRRRPDVRATYNGKPIAVEIQLATTQIPIIVAREEFYKKEGRYLIWITWNFEPVERRNLITSFEDIYYSHSKNLFSLDDETVAASRKSGTLQLRVFWESASVWHSKICNLTDLEWPPSGLPFAVAQAPPWHLDFRKRWLEATEQTGTRWPDRMVLLSELAERIKAHQVDWQSLDESDIADLINAILSFIEGRPVGSAQRNLAEVINTFLSTQRRHRFSRIMRTVLTVTEGVSLLDRQSVKEKFAIARRVTQDNRESVAGAAMLALFPELFREAKKPT